MKLSIVVPVYNEKNTILEVLRRIDSVDINMEKEVIIVDGCSTDGTKEILKSLKNRHIKFIFEEKREGKGAAIIRGFKEASGDIFLIQDADLEVNPIEYPRLLRPILEEHVRVVYGSRFLYGRGLTRIKNYLGNKTVTWVLNLLFFTKLSDMATCYKVFVRDAWEKLDLNSKGFEIEAEITINLIKNRERIVEIPIRYIPRSRSEGKKLHWGEGFRALQSIIKLRFTK
ncbi:MAG: glycosyltransferase family 2 protein [Candidatus Omnitrophota bacterium]